MGNDAPEDPSADRTRDGAGDTLGSFQVKIQSGHPPFLAAKASSWSATDKGTLVQELKSLVSRRGGDPYGKLVRTGSAHRGTVADAQTNEEREAIIWTTNLYMGLNRDPDVMEEARSAIARFGTGMGTSAAASGVTDLHLEFARAFAEHVGKPAACVFPTGYTANQGVIAGLLGAADVVVMDQLSADIAAALAALRRLSADDTLRERLWDTTTYMRKRFSEAGYDLGTGDGPIVTPHFPDKDKLYAIAAGMYRRGVHTVAVTYPIVETGRGRLRFICSAAHTRADVDKTLQALIEAEREAEDERQALVDHVSGDGESEDPGRSGVEAWANGFCSYLKETRAGASGPAPNLAVSIGLPDDGERITIVVDERDVTLAAHETTHLPACSLLFANHTALAALCSSDVQGLLDGVLKGSCVLKGQVEPFIWLIGRMADSHRGRDA
ncbi:MAG: aminotransferase class I/II-fold pyridoxal phosphate-dependent enzyme [Thioalkalivibrio sp.]|nr:aminotransferase class I/II-fold pyridoxal phosphate-dependent enzyme [Thioalkalivibrio sp.]